MMQMKTMKWRNAYLLFYERKSTNEFSSDEEVEKSESVNNMDVEMKNIQTTMDINIPNDIEEKILYDN